VRWALTILYARHGALALEGCTYTRGGFSNCVWLLGARASARGSRRVSSPTLSAPRPTRASSVAATPRPQRNCIILRLTIGPPPRRTLCCIKFPNRCRGGAYKHEVDHRPLGAWVKPHGDGQACTHLRPRDQRPLDALSPTGKPQRANDRTESHREKERAQKAPRHSVRFRNGLTGTAPAARRRASCFPIVEWSAWDEGPGPSPKTKMRVI
jgi:hypothetical protein